MRLVQCVATFFIFFFIYLSILWKHRKNSHGTTTTITTTQTTTTKNEKKMCETIELTFLDNKITDQNDFNGTKIIRVAAVWMHSGCFRKWKKETKTNKKPSFFGYIRWDFPVFRSSRWLWLLPDFEQQRIKKHTGIFAVQMFLF